MDSNNIQGIQGVRQQVATRRDEDDKEEGGVDDLGAFQEQSTGNEHHGATFRVDVTSRAIGGHVDSEQEQGLQIF